MFISLIGFGFLGGISGVMMGTEQLNLIIHNTIYVPGHFHATVVVGTTLAFMALTYFLIPTLFRREIMFPKLAKWQPYLFGLGMSGFALFMMGAGTLGVPRRHWDMTFAGNPLGYEFAGTAYLMMGLIAHQRPGRDRRRRIVPAHHRRQRVLRQEDRDAGFPPGDDARGRGAARRRASRSRRRSPATATSASPASSRRARSRSRWCSSSPSSSTTSSTGSTCRRSGRCPEGTRGLRSHAAGPAQPHTKRRDDDERNHARRSDRRPTPASRRRAAGRALLRPLQAPHRARHRVHGARRAGVTPGAGAAPGGAWRCSSSPWSSLRRRAGAFNQYVERDIDVRMTRTKRRPFVTGRLAHSPALAR